MLKLLSSLLGLSHVTNAQENEATATFDAANNGIDGYVMVTNGILYINLNVSGLNLSEVGGEDCLEGGLKYHIHEKWTYDDTNDRVSGDSCSGDYTGGHWDPWLGCGSATGNTYCSAKGGCVTGSSVLGDDGYDCSSSTFEENPFACEVGDWSGKYGLVDVNDDGSVVLMAESPYEVMSSDLTDLSVVFHCNDGSRAFCSPFEVTSGGVDADRPTQSLAFFCFLFLFVFVFLYLFLCWFFFVYEQKNKCFVLFFVFFY